MAALLILQTAVDEGLGACFFGIPAEHTGSFREAFGIPADHEPVGAITVGHRVADRGASGSPARRERRTDVVHRGRWGG
jgi:nitroreductase